ncbi:hypothetical protein, partial [Streptomyces sp. YGL11-2]|uniref:hypothetical protein n=1 Tax=Streptomyces sp. YGL11-2 TaxID=3414028 RepID=UPI003CEB70BE
MGRRSRVPTVDTAMIRPPSGSRRPASHRALSSIARTTAQAREITRTLPQQYSDGVLVEDYGLTAIDLEACWSGRSAGWWFSNRWSACYS